MVADVNSFLTAETDFGLDMLRKLSLNESNVVSPLSVIFALNIVQPGAKGKTKTQITEAISKGSTDNDTIEYYSNLMQQILNATNDVQSKIANAFFVRNGVEIKDDYADKITKKFCAKLECRDFNQAHETAKVINDFVNESTAGKIKEIVKANAIQGAISIIINAIYFKAEWDVKFRNCYNSTGKFYSAPDREREVEYMRQSNTHRLYAEDDDAQVLSLLYKDKTYAFNIILPKNRFGLEELVKNWSGERVQNLLTKLKDTFITVVIPKMKIETDFELKEALLNMGIEDMFSDAADLSGISSIPLRVSSAIHKALIEVDEEGTTAAAVTAMMMFGAAPRTAEPVQFIADHPFLFILTKDNNPLFMGVFV
ncbi:unnamed protein product [Cylicocyclus nassatus]|uniref:Serpin domain-containing protein n=1 Tax=Cylicocyclus nassatus TaxID=53992 RepID=A0AA36DKH8_CYLNA|nr:unnamed protein product [Cylicocyclus nassatus]